MKAAAALSAYICAIAVSAGAAHADHYANHRAGDYPLHHALWLCIHRSEATSWTATNGRYRGGLQLHLGWGYGSSYDAAQDTQAQQEWSAENAYRASGYARSFLVGQWIAYDGAWRCMNLA